MTGRTMGHGGVKVIRELARDVTIGAVVGCATVAHLVLSARLWRPEHLRHRLANQSMLTFVLALLQAIVLTPGVVVRLLLGDSIHSVDLRDLAWTNAAIYAVATWLVLRWRRRRASRSVSG